MSFVASSQELLRAAIAPNNKICSESSLLNNEEDKEIFINKILTMYMDLGLSKRKYDLLRTYNKCLFGDKLYPSYTKIQVAKKQCYSQNITVTKNGAKIKLQFPARSYYITNHKITIKAKFSRHRH